MPFQKGNTLGKIGRPKNSKNILPIIRQKILTKLHKRIAELDSVAIEELLSFARQIMPKDISVKHTADIQYISNTPRPESIIDVTPKRIAIDKKEEREETKSSMSSNNSSNDNDSLNTIDNLNDISSISIREGVDDEQTF